MWGCRGKNELLRTNSNEKMLFDKKVFYKNLLLDRPKPSYIWEKVELLFQKSKKDYKKFSDELQKKTWKNQKTKKVLRKLCTHFFYKKLTLKTNGKKNQETSGLDLGNLRNFPRRKKYANFLDIWYENHQIWPKIKKLLRDFETTIRSSF